MTLNNLTKYLLPFLEENEQKQLLREQEILRKDVAPSVGPETGKLLTFLVRTLNAQEVLEIGTCQGYSTLWLADGLKATGGNLIAIESNALIIEEASRSIASAGFEKIKFIIGDAKEKLKELPLASFDLILQDSAKGTYRDMLDDCVKLLRIGGILISDDILFKPLGKRASIANAMHDYNSILMKDERLFTTFLSTGDGVAMSLKIKE